MLDQKDHLLLKLLQDNSLISASDTGEGSHLLKICVQNSRMAKCCVDTYVGCAFNF